MPDRGPFEPAPGRDGGPAFAEPWQAELMGIAFTLAEAGVFTPADWSRALGAALAGAAGEPDTEETYYRAALRALQVLLAESGALSSTALAERTEAWRSAYLATPHGEPVVLGAGGDRRPD